MSGRRIKAIAEMLAPLGHHVREKCISDMTVRFADGKLRDVEVDGRFYTLIDGLWFRLDKVVRK